MKYYSALRPYVMKRLEELEQADIIVGIPAFNNQGTIEHVIKMVSHGLNEHFHDLRPVIVVSDGGSTDDTRDVAKEFELKPWQERIVGIYRGTPGKGTALRMILEVARNLNARACMVVDSDLRSITNLWVKNLLQPILEKDYDFAAPIYTRYKYDGTITNNIIYNLCQAAFGKKIRQPIGGDFAFSRNLVNFYIQQDVWETDVAKFGIDIWLTIQAIIRGFRMCQTHLGRKIHDAKDPSEHLGPMFRQVVSTLFALMEETEGYWKNVTGVEQVPVFGEMSAVEPDPIDVNFHKLVSSFKSGLRHFGTLWEEIFCDDCFEALKAAAALDDSRFRLPTDTWVRVLYEIAGTYHNWPSNRRRLVDLMTPLYYGRVASFVNETASMSSLEAERLVEEQAAFFVEAKDYLMTMWDNPRQCSTTFIKEAEEL
ncbi:MAG: glucosylglycerate synthase [Thermodesulfobacteriota bacterium]|nr:glucosylglycerate synthase [Thermodesulfobacteriota bacterium]